MKYRLKIKLKINIRIKAIITKGRENVLENITPFSILLTNSDRIKSVLG